MLRSKTEIARAHDSRVPAFIVALLLLSLLSLPLLRQALVSAAPVLMPDAGLPFPGLMASSLDRLLLGWNLSFQVWPFVALAANALFLALLWRDMAGAFGRRWASGLTLLVGCNPLFLLTMANGSQALALLAFYGLCRTLRRLETPVEAFTYLRIAGWLCILFSLNQQTLVLSAMVAPWFVLVMPPAVRREAPLSFYLVCYLPLAFLIGAWAYLNLTIFKAPWPTLAALAQDSAPLPVPLIAYGDSWLPALRWAVAAVACFPLLILVTHCRTGALTRGVLASAGTVISTAALAFALGWAGFDTLLLLWVPAALLLRALKADHRLHAAALLTLGIFGAAWVQPQGWAGWMAEADNVIPAASAAQQK